MSDSMKLIDIREALAMNCVEGIYKDMELMQIYMEGFTGYNNESDDDVVDWYVNQNFPEMGINDDEPTEVLTITKDDGVTVAFKVIQHQSDIEIKKV